MRSLGIFDEQSGRSKSKPVPLTTLTTPGGNPHSSKSPSAIEVAKGVCSLSLIRKGRNATFKSYLPNTLQISRTDLLVSIDLSYSSILHNFGIFSKIKLHASIPLDTSCLDFIVRRSTYCNCISDLT